MSLAHMAYRLDKREVWVREQARASPQPASVAHPLPLTSLKATHELLLNP